MTKSQLIARLADRYPRLSKRDAEVIVNTIFDGMAQALSEGDRIEIRGFGSFIVKIRDSREGRNPKTGERVAVPQKRTPFFTVGKELKERVNNMSPDILLETDTEDDGDEE